jgi:hypothetical protein
MQAPQLEFTLLSPQQHAKDTQEKFAAQEKIRRMT